MNLPAPLTRWFASRGWAVRGAQRAMLAAAAAGEHALLVAPTGSGKTLAGFLPTLAELIELPTEGLHTLYVSPLKALAADVARNLITPIAEMGLDIRVETRTGDTSSEHKKRQRYDPPQILLTTPESLSLLLSYPDAAAMLAGVRTVIVDEIHAFATTKRGDLLSLALASVAYWRSGGKEEVRRMQASLEQEVDALRAKQAELMESSAQTLANAYDRSRRRLEEARDDLRREKEDAVKGMEEQVKLAQEDLEALARKLEDTAHAARDATRDCQVSSASPPANDQRVSRFSD